jgi:hypothetical protein
MTHDEARELMGAVPDEASPELLAHLQSCAQCQAYRDELRVFNDKLRRALELDWQKVQRTALARSPVPVPPAQRAVASDQQEPSSPPDRATVSVLPEKESAPQARHRRPRLFALAAGIAAASLIGVTLWLSRPPTSLAAEIVTHIEGEPASWRQTQLVPAEKLDAVLRKSSAQLGAGMQPVVYASSCWFRGHFVPHVVVTTPDGPVTVMILLHERVNIAQQFNEDGYTGLLVPAPTGSVAVLSRTPINLGQPAAAVVRALQSAH